MTPLTRVLLSGVALEGMVDVKQSEMVAIWVSEEVLHVVGTFSVGGWAYEDLRHGEQGCETEDFIGTIELRRGDEHDGQGRVKWKFRGETAQMS